VPRQAPANAREDRFKLDPLRIALFLLILISLSRLHLHFGLDRFRPALLLAVITVAYALFNPRSVSTANLLRYWPAKVMVALAVTACFSAAFGLSLGGSGSFILFNFSKVLILAFLLIAGIRTAGELKFFVWAIALSCGVLAYYALFVFQLGYDSASFAARLTNWYTYDSNDVSCILMMGLPLTILAFQTSNTKLKGLAGLILLGIGAAVARGGSRGGFVSLVAVGLTLLLFVPHVSVIKRTVFVMAVMAGLVLFAPRGYWDQMETIVSLEEDYNWTSIDGRKQLAERGLDYMKRYPVFGIGVDNFARAEGTISGKDEIVSSGVRWTPAHNSFVQAGAEMGVVGLVLWTWLALAGVFGMRSLRRRLPRHWRRGTSDQRFLYTMTIYMPVSLIGFSVAAFFVSFAYEDPLYILAALMTATYVCAEKELAREKRHAAGLTVAGPLPTQTQRPVAMRRPAAMAGR
jgi:O-antigen ligase